MGLSLRDWQEMMALTLGDVLSLSACNRIVSSVTARVEAFKSAPLENPPPGVMVDGMGVKIAYPSEAIKADARGRRRYAKRKQKRVVLRALGGWPDGHGEIVHGHIAEGEPAESWQALFKELQSQGITRETTQLVTSDGAPGLESALDRYLWGVPHQRCLFHKIKNLADHLGFNDLQVESAETKEQAVREAKRARKQAVLAEAGGV